jgi:hypothetical protein
MNARTLAAFFLIASASALGQSSLSRATLQQSLGFEDQTDSTLTSWHSYPPGSVSADNQIAHSGHWSVRLRRDAQSTGTFSVITRSVPVDFQSATIELRGYLRLQEVSDYAGLWVRQDADGQKYTKQVVVPVALSSGDGGVMILEKSPDARKCNSLRRGDDADAFRSEAEDRSLCGKSLSQSRSVNYSRATANRK